MQNYPLGRITHQPLWEWAINTVSRYNKDNNNTVEAMDTAKMVTAESIQQGICECNAIITCLKRCMYILYSFETRKQTHARPSP